MAVLFSHSSYVNSFSTRASHHHSTDVQAQSRPIITPSLAMPSGWVHLWLVIAAAQIVKFTEGLWSAQFPSPFWNPFFEAQARRDVNNRNSVGG